MTYTESPSTPVDSLSEEVRIYPPERFNFDWCQEFRRYLRAGGPHARFLLDFSNTQSLDSAALGMLLQLEERAGSDRGRLRFAHVPAHLQSLIEIAGLGAYLS